MTRILCLIALQLSVARAEGRIGIVDLRGPAEERRELRDAIERAVEARGLQVIPDADVGYLQATERDLFECFGEDRCKSEFGRRLHANLLLTGRIAKEGDEWQASLSLHAVDLGVGNNQVIHCPSCSVENFRDRLVESVNDLIVANQLIPRAQLVVRTRPPGAGIAIDGRPVGAAEVEVTVSAGMHRVEATHPNHDLYETTIEVKPQQRMELDLKLPPRVSHAAPEPIAPKGNSSWWTMRRIASVAMLAAGGALVISGIPLLAIDGSCGDDHCVFVHDTGAGGGALLGIGAALAVTGAVVLLTSRSAQSPALSAIERSFTSATHW